MTGMDRISEEIAHFIGMFNITVEQARLRDAYHEFTPLPAVPSNPELPEASASEFAAPHTLLGYDPGMRYAPPGWSLEEVSPWLPLKYKYFKIQAPGQYPFGHPQGPSPEPGSGMNINITLPEIDPPGSVASYIVQNIYLSDNDYFGVGGHGLKFSPQPIDNGELFEFALEALSLSPIGSHEMPGGAEAIKDFITSVAEELENYTPDTDGSAEIHVFSGETLNGIYVNGKLVTEAPSIDDYHRFGPEEAEENSPEHTPVKNVKITYDGHMQIEASVSISAGGNTVVNDAVLTNIWTGGTVTVVAGDYFQLDAVIQINAICDEDMLSSTITNWSVDEATNQFFNIATFKHTNPLDNNDGAQTSGSAEFPSYWIVTEITGDLLIVNWLDQYIFQSDNDVGIVSSSGVTTEIIAGDNLAVNTISIMELAYAYDIIVIGGSWYDANIIQQLNVLYDNDLIGALDGFQTTGEGSVSTSGNLLWNEALIYSVSGDYGDMPAHYQELADNLAAGKEVLPSGVLSDPALAGNEALRVLYIEGDLINLNYIRQSSIVGDSDQIALAMNEFTPRADAEWTITTGGNALLNHAAIVDLDSLGNIHVGGEQYSQAMLVQAELISDKPEFWAQDPDALVNEAVAFLDDSIDDGPDDTPAYYLPDNEAPGGDGLQAMLG